MSYDSEFSTFHLIFLKICDKYFLIYEFMFKKCVYIYKENVLHVVHCVVYFVFIFKASMKRSNFILYINVFVIVTYSKLIHLTYVQSILVVANGVQ